MGRLTPSSQNPSQTGFHLLGPTSAGRRLGHMSTIKYALSQRGDHLTILPLKSSATMENTLNIKSSQHHHRTPSNHKAKTPKKKSVPHELRFRMTVKMTQIIIPFHHHLDRHLSSYDLFRLRRLGLNHPRIIPIPAGTTNANKNALSEDLSTEEGFLHCVQLVARLREGGLLWLITF